MEDRSLAKALKRKIGLDEDILTRKQYAQVEVSLLMNPTRRGMFEFVCNHPCSHLRDISRKLDLSIQSTTWHLSKLTEWALIAWARKGKMKVFYPNSGTLDTGVCNVLFVLRKKDHLETYRFLEKHPKETQDSMGELLDIYQQRLSSILLSLERAGLIAHEKKGRIKIYSITDEIGNLRAAYDAKSTAYVQWIMDVLTRDGMNPSLSKSDHETVTLELDTGSHKTPFIVINKNPLAQLMRASQKKAIP